MNITQSIHHAAESFRDAGHLSPSHCDVRCAINDLTADDPAISRRGYNQTRAWLQVRRQLGTPPDREAVADRRREDRRR